MVKRVSRVRNILDYREGGNVSNQVPSSQESSETEFVEEEKPWPPSLSHQSRCKTLDRQVRRVEPRPQSHLFRRGPGEGKERRSRHSRRWENSAFLSSLGVVTEGEESATPLPSHHSLFTQLHSSEKHMQIWTSFSSRSEEEQRDILEGVSGRKCDSVRGGECDPRSRDVEESRAKERFHKIDHRIRSVLQHSKQLPRELLFSLEEELRFEFDIDSSHTVSLLTHPHAYSRLLLHGLCQYLGLCSTTVDCEDVSIVMVTGNNYTPPDTWLTTFLNQD